MPPQPIPPKNLDHDRWMPPVVDSQNSLATGHRGPGATRLSTSSACFIDFFEARDWLSGHFEIESEVREAADRQKRSVNQVGPLEKSLYWLISAAALVCLLTGILCLPLTTPQTQRTGTEQSSLTSLPATTTTIVRLAAERERGLIYPETKATSYQVRVHQNEY
jgi:hypothetical protein